MRSSDTSSVSAQVARENRELGKSARSAGISQGLHPEARADGSSLVDLFERRPQRFLNVKSAAGIVGKSANTIRRWIAEKRIKAYKVGGTLVVDRDSLRWIIRDPCEEDAAPTLTGREGGQPVEHAQEHSKSLTRRRTPESI